MHNVRPGRNSSNPLWRAGEIPAVGPVRRLSTSDVVRRAFILLMLWSWRPVAVAKATVVIQDNTLPLMMATTRLNIVITAGITTKVIGETFIGGWAFLALA